MEKLAEDYSIPRYLISLLDVSGYTTLIALKQVLQRSHLELKETLTKYGEYILSENFENSEVRESFKIDCAKYLISTSFFMIPPGHVDFLIGILEEDHPIQTHIPNKNLVVRKRKSQTQDEDKEDQLEQSYYENQPPNKGIKFDTEESVIEFEAEEDSLIQTNLPQKPKLRAEEGVSYFTEPNKRRLANLIRKCWPPELEAPDYFMLEEVNFKCWTIQCSQCEGILKIFLITNGGYLRFNKSNFQRHLQNHVKNMTFMSNDVDAEITENTE